MQHLRHSKHKYALHARPPSVPIVCMVKSRPRVDLPVQTGAVRRGVDPYHPTPPPPPPLLLLLLPPRPVFPVAGLADSHHRAHSTPTTLLLCGNRITTISPSGRTSRVGVGVAACLGRQRRGVGTSTRSSNEEGGARARAGAER